MTKRSDVDTSDKRGLLTSSVQLHDNDHKKENSEIRFKTRVGDAFQLLGSMVPEIGKFSEDSKINAYNALS